MREFEILITSPPDREKLVAEIWFKNELIAEINQENTEMELQIYAYEKLNLPFEGFYRAMEDAANKLLRIGP